MKDKMLIVDDIKANRENLKRIFDSDFEMLEATSGEEGLELLAQYGEKIRIVLLDLLLPKMSGFDFLEERKKSDYYQKIPCIMITSSDKIDDQVKGFSLGVNDFIVNPFVDEIVKARVNNVMVSSGRIRHMEAKYQRMKIKAILDDMTGLHNKKSTEDAIDSSLRESEGELEVLMIIDIDHFKTVNDTLGHQVGDRVIRIVSKIISSSIRQTDIVGRIGGDEFCVLMKNVPDMNVVYRKLRELLQIMKYKPNIAIPEYVTLSIGIATNERKNTTYFSLFKKADEALLRAKVAGRARYCEYGVEEPAPTQQPVNYKSRHYDQKKSASGLVLLVDDDPINRKILRNVLQNTYEIIEAENGVEAMKLIRKFDDRIVTIVLDLIMPIMNGYQVLEEVRRNNNWKNIPIIISTVDDSEESDLKSLNLGANLILHKPINPAIALKQIEKQVETYKERRSDIQEYMLHKTMIGNKDNTFLCTYHFATGKVELGDKYLQYMSEDFPQLFAAFPFQYEKFTLPTDNERVQEFFDVYNNPNVHEEMEVRFRIDNVHYEWFEISKMVNYDENQKVDKVIFMFLNIENAMEVKKNLLFLATHDNLTHIPNTQTFSSDVTAMLNAHPDIPFIMVTMDIFQFRVVNNLFGHKEGDSIIRYVAMKLQELVETFDIGAYCRMSSDVFCICIPESEDIASFMQTMQQAMYSYRLKFQLKLSFGIYRIYDRSESVETMVEHSSFARRRTKEAPIKTFLYYDEELRKKEVFETVVVTEMDSALRDDQFEVYLQPKCEIKTGAIIGAEALIRWNHPERGYLSPGYFVPIFEKNGTCQELDYFVYEDVCKTLRRWIDEDYPVVPISVNVSRWSLYNDKLSDHILKIVDKYKIPHELIEFEITESAFVVESNLLTHFSDRMRSNGFHILIDDFGSGYSSLNSLKDISVDVLKIDIKFLPVSSGEEKAEIVLSSVISMAQRLGLGVIAEGVENAEQIELLSSLGCQYVQGYYFYRPMRIVDFQPLLQKNKD